MKLIEQVLILVIGIGLFDSAALMETILRFQ
jgi:hypothetical protein